MNRINFKLILKHLGKHKLYTSITIVGFSVSLMFIVLLCIYIKQEFSVDQFHEKKDRIFRLYHEGGSSHFAYKVGTDLKGMYPEIESFTSFYHNEYIIKWNDKQIKSNLFLVDSTFFNIFSFSLLEGDKSNCLNTTSSIVLSETYAEKMFEGESPMGKVVRFSDREFTVTGVMKDMPKKSHFTQCDALINFKTLAEMWNYPGLLTSYDNNSFGIYFLAKENTHLPSKAPQVLNFLKREHWMYKQNRVKTVAFEPLTDVYFSDAQMNGLKRNSKVLLTVLSAIVFLILALSIINYTNLTIAQSGSRGKEFAVRKMMGGSRRMVTLNFIAESIILCFVSALIALTMGFIVEPIFNNLLNTDLELQETLNWTFLFYVVVMIFFVGMLSGLIAALSINRINPIEAVKGKIKSNGPISYSKLLVSFQYIVVIVLIICSLFIRHQNRFLMQKKLGFNKNNIIWVVNQINTSQKQAFKDEMKKIAGVQEVAFVRGSPIDGGNNQSYVFNDIPVSFQEFYFDSIGIHMLGLNVTPTNMAYSQNGIYLNEAAVKKLELDDLSEFKFYDNKLPVLGIVDDFNFSSLHNKIGPAIIHQMKPNVYAWMILIKINPNNVTQTINKIKQTYNNFTGGLPLEINFMDSTVDSWYQSEVNTFKIISYFTLLAIIISAMGILAMSVFYARERIKEIGIRKVNGAKGREILSMLNADFMQWVIISFIIACPTAWFIMDKWLDNFAYKATMNWWIYAFAGMIALAIALISVSWQSWQAARRNPVETLRYE